MRHVCRHANWQSLHVSSWLFKTESRTYFEFFFHFRFTSVCKEQIIRKIGFTVKKESNILRNVVIGTHLEFWKILFVTNMWFRGELDFNLLLICACFVVDWNEIECRGNSVNFFTSRLIYFPYPTIIITAKLSTICHFFTRSRVLHLNALPNPTRTIIKIILMSFIIQCYSDWFSVLNFSYNTTASRRRKHFKYKSSITNVQMITVI